MNKLLKFTQTADQQIYFSSDFHAYHKQPFVWQTRGFNSIEEHKDYILEEVNQTIRRNDILFYAGDLTLNCNEEQFGSFIDAINCQNIYLLFGNHNSPIWTIYGREIKSWLGSNYEGNSSENGGTIHVHNIDTEIYPFRYKNLIFVGNYLELSVDNQTIILSHYPIHSWNHMKHASWNLYGHQHCKNNPRGGKRFDIGFDRDKRPYSFHELKVMMDMIPVVSDGGHH